jgi:ribonuclease Z
VTIDTEGQRREVKPEDVLGSPRPGRKIVYTGDTRAVHTTLGDFARNADLLIHDATYDDTEAARAAEFYHATASQAGEAAASLSARTLILVHISSRYIDSQAHISDAKKKFSGPVTAPNDLDKIEVPFRD